MNQTIVLLLTSVCSLMVLGFTVLTSAMMLKTNGAFLHPFVVKQAIAAAAGFAVFVLAAKIDLRRLMRLAPWVYGFAVLLLILTLTPAGKVTNGAQRWLLGVQPSDFAKPALILALAWHGARFSHRLGGFWAGAVLMGLVALPAPLLVLVEPDKGTAALLMLIAGLMMFVAGVRILHLAMPAAAVIAAFVVLINNSDYAKKRWKSFVDPEANHENRLQVEESLFAFGAGGAEGVGLGRGAYKFKVPEQHTDFILTVVGEELGLPCTLSVLGAYGMILLCGATIAARAPDRFGQLVAAGITFTIAAQAVVNAGVVTDLLPNKGMPLPFVSRGGTSLVVMLGMAGLLLNVASRCADTPSTSTQPAANPFGIEDTEVPA
jgi:cell division protein FtsW